MEPESPHPVDSSAGEPLLARLEAIVALGAHLQGFAQRDPHDVFEAARAALQRVLGAETLAYFELDGPEKLRPRPTWCSRAGGGRQLGLDVARAVAGDALAELLEHDRARTLPVPGSERCVRVQRVGTATHQAGVFAIAVGRETAFDAEQANLLSIVLIHCASAIELSTIAHRIEAELDQLESSRAGPQAGDAATDAEQAGGPRVLVAEDDPLNQKITARILARLGCAVEVASDGDAAARLAREAAFDLIFMDCEMPVLDGFGAAARIRDEERQNGGDRHTPIVGVTDPSSGCDRDVCCASGMDDAVSKPVKQADLKSMLDRWVAAR